MPVSAQHAFLAPDNLVGWTRADLLALALTVLLAWLLRGRSFRFPALTRLAHRPLLCAAALFCLPIALRLALIPAGYGVPVPSGADDFGYLLLADTLRHARLANPALPFPDAFAQIFVLESPAYAAIFPLGQGLALTAGSLLFGNPWAGVLLSGGCLCALVYWMLRGWMTPEWALAGGALSVTLFGPLCYWMNCYWGGYVSAMAGCLAFGAVGRFRKSGSPWGSGFALGLGLGLQAITRQYETVLLAMALVAIGVAEHRRLLPAGRSPGRRVRFAIVTAAPVLLALFLIAAQNASVTGHWNRLPYWLYRYNYGVPATFTWQPNPVPHAALSGARERDYRMEAAVHGAEPESPLRYLARLGARLRFLRFFWTAPLTLAVFAAALLKRRKFPGTILAAIAVFVLGSNFYPYFYPHYVAAAACLFVWAAAEALACLPAACRHAVLLMTAFQFLLFLGLHFAGWSGPEEAWDWINRGDPQHRLQVEQQLARAGGRNLVFVHESPVHGFAEWIHNPADVDTTPNLWVHDLGRERNREVVQHYRDRRDWILFVDENPPVLRPYAVSSSPFEEVQ